MWKLYSHKTYISMIHPFLLTLLNIVPVASDLEHILRALIQENCGKKYYQPN